MIYQTRNWISAILATSLLIVLALALAPFAVHRSADPYFERPSTFFTDPSGARALLLVMKKLLLSVEQWRRPLNLLPLPDEPGSPATLIVAGPKMPISKAEADHLDQWLFAGGQLILASGDGWPVASRLSPEENVKTKAETGSVKAPAQGELKNNLKKPTYLSRHGATVQWSKRTEPSNERITGLLVPTGELTVQSRQNFATIEGAKIVASAGGRPLAVEIPVGSGRIVALADPTIVSNRALREADNAVWLVALAAGWGNGKSLFDEFHHGFGRQRRIDELTWAFLQTPWGGCVGQLALAGLFYVFGYRRRFGRISEPAAVERTSPLELVAARAGLFQAAAAQGLAVELIVRNLERDAGQVYGRSPDISRLGRKADASNEVSDSAGLFARLGDLSAKAAQGQRLTDPEFTEVGRLAGRIQQGSVR